MTKNLLGSAPVAVAAGLGALAVAGNAMLSKRSRSRSEEDGPETMRDRANPQVAAMDKAFERFFQEKSIERENDLQLIASDADEQIEALGEGLKGLKGKVGKLWEISQRDHGLTYVRENFDEIAMRMVDIDRVPPDEARLRAYAVVMRSLLRGSDSEMFAKLAGTTPGAYIERFYPR